MGVTLLNTFLHSYVKNTTKKLNLRDLRGKRIVVDISIYMYRFIATNSLIENMYMLCSLFRYYNIHALFIFDGEGRRDEKRETLLKRKQQKDAAINKFNLYELELSKLSNGSKRDDLTAKMDTLRRTFAKLTRSDVENTKALLDAYGMMYRVSPGEADELCAALVMKGAAYACLSEDTDMFIYGCPRVLKYISLINHTVILYDLSIILKKLELSYDNFKTMCLFSGTDYISGDTNRNIFHNYDLYKDFKNQTCENSTFLKWLLHENYMTCHKHCKICQEIQRNDDVLDTVLNGTKYFLIRNKQKNTHDLKQILKLDGFVFPN